MAATTVSTVLDLMRNPLVNPPQQKFNAPPMGLFKPADVEPAVDLALGIAQKNIQAIIDNPDEPTFENTVAALSFADQELDRVYAPFSEITSSMNTSEAQAVEKSVLPKLIAFGDDIFLNEALFKKVEAVYNNIDHASLSEEEQTLLEKTYNSFKNNGIALSADDQKHFKALNTRLSELTTSYSNNLTNHAAELKIIIPAADKARLDGIPKDVIASYAQNAKNDRDVANDAYVIKMMPPPRAVFEYAHDRSLREEVMRTSDKIASEGQYDNTQNVLEILKVRHELAQLLGFKNHAERIIRKDTRMAENPQNVMAFLNRNAKVYGAAAKTFYAELSEFAKKQGGLDEIKPWDRSYYTRLMRKEKIGYDPEALRPYFPLDNVLKGLFQHSEALHKVQFKETSDYSKMHEDIRFFEVLDAKTGEIKALYTLDPYAREHKSGGAWMNGLRVAGLYNGQREIPIVTNTCNFMKPAEGQPSLLSADDVTTLFHEKGHGLHGMLTFGNVEYPSLSGTNVLRDYVEFPSQINECWAFAPEVLKTYAKHYKTGEVIPQKFIDQLQQLKQFDARWQGVRQTEFALFDMAAYTTDPAEIEKMGLKAFQDKVWADTQIIPSDAPPFALGFPHMINGYDAGYYVYKWAEATVADVFAQFEEQGLYNKNLCESFDPTMIAPAGMRHPTEMFKDFMEAAGQGRRDLDPEALFRAEGLLPPKKVAGNDNTPVAVTPTAKPAAPGQG